MMKTDRILRVAVMFCMCMLLDIAVTDAACRNPNLAGKAIPGFRRVAGSKFIEIK